MSWKEKFSRVKTLAEQKEIDRRIEQRRQRKENERISRENERIRNKLKGPVYKVCKYFVRSIKGKLELHDGTTLYLQEHSKEHYPSTFIEVNILSKGVFIYGKRYTKAFFLRHPDAHKFSRYRSHWDNSYPSSPKGCIYIIYEIPVDKFTVDELAWVLAVLGEEALKEDAKLHFIHC